MMREISLLVVDAERRFSRIAETVSREAGAAAAVRWHVVEIVVDALFGLYGADFYGRRYELRFYC